MIIDVHNHTVDLPESQDIETLVREASLAGVGGLITSGYDLNSSLGAVNHAKTYRGVVATVGLHPWFVSNDYEQTLRAIEPLYQTMEVVGVGELGLDGMVEVPMSLQETAFLAQLTVAAKLHLPVVVHSRKAIGRTIDLLRLSHPNTPIVMHSFSGTPDDAKRIADLGVFFSFSGTLTRNNARRALDLARYLPDDLLLVETDSPAIAMEGIPAGMVRPAHASLVRSAMARCRNLTDERMDRVLFDNTLKVFGGRLLAGLATGRSCVEDTTYR